MQPDTKKILTEIQRRGHGAAFSPKDFLGMASRGTIDVALSSLTADGVIRRIGRGLYDYPKKSDLVDEMLPPDIDQAAQAIARKHRWTITPEGAAAANMLGLSQQVPAKIVYLSDGPTRQIKFGQRMISFRHASFKDLRMETPPGSSLRRCDSWARRTSTRRCSTSSAERSPRQIEPSS